MPVEKQSDKAKYLNRSISLSIIKIFYEFKFLISGLKNDLVPSWYIEFIDFLILL